MRSARAKWHESPAAWAFILKRYLPRMALCSLLWELVQLPLYTIWSEAKPGKITFAVVHCTAGDVLIGIAALLIALLLIRADKPDNWPIRRVGMLTALLAVSYTLSSERINIAQGNWVYSSWMPVLPYVEVGLSPLLQWVVVPLAALWWARRR